MRTTLLLVPLFAAPLAAAGQVFVVAPVPGPGVTHTTISAAVTAASDGDLVLIRSGTYAEFVHVVGKSLTLAADSGASVSVTSGLDIKSLATNQRVAVQGLEIRGNTFYPFVYEAATAVQDCQGSVEFDACRLLGDNGYIDTFQSVYEFGASGCGVVNSASVAFSSCVIRGGDGGAHPHCTGGSTGSTSAGGGIMAYASTVAVYGSELRGGDGVEGSVQPCHGSWGGDGLGANKSTAHVAGSQLFGGKGSCDANPGQPGTGARSMGSGANVELLASSTTAGGGCGGPQQPTLALDGGAIDVLPGAQDVGLDVLKPPSTPTGVFREGQAGVFELHADPGSIGWLALGAPAPALALPGIIGPAQLSTPVAFAAFGVVPASGTAQLSFTTPDQGVGVAWNPVGAQALVLRPDGAIVLGETRSLVALDAAF